MRALLRKPRHEGRGVQGSLFGNALDDGPSAAEIRLGSAAARAAPAGNVAPSPRTGTRDFHEMMMAYDSGPTPNGGLSASVIDRVSTALTGYLATPDASSDDLRAALYTMANEARTNAMPPEKLLVVLKDVWYALPGVRESKERDEQVRLLQRVVTMCINEYYRA